MRPALDAERSGEGSGNGHVSRLSALVRRAWPGSRWLAVVVRRELAYLLEGMQLSAGAVRVVDPSAREESS